jgi:hypothetical protein
MADAADRLLARLEKVRSVGAGKWKACCPAHEDRDPSLAIREADDGRLLIYCFAGCSAAEVLAAVGLSLGDLYPKPLGDRVGPLWREPAYLGMARTVLGLAAGDRKAGRRLSRADLEAERQAYLRTREWSR